MSDDAFEDFNRSVMKAPVGITEGGGIQRVLPIPRESAGVTRPYPCHQILVAGQSKHESDTDVVEGKCG